MAESAKIKEKYAIITVRRTGRDCFWGQIAKFARQMQ
jgi:hypothetical protein